MKVNNKKNGVYKMKIQELKEITDSYMNGQKKQMIEQIDNYGALKFFQDLHGYLNFSVPSQRNLLRSIIVSYNTIKGM